MIKALQEAAKIFLLVSKKLPLVKEEADIISDIISEKYLNLFRTPLSSAHPQGGVRMGKTHLMLFVIQMEKIIEQVLYMYVMLLFFQLQ